MKLIRPSAFLLILAFAPLGAAEAPKKAPAPNLIASPAELARRIPPGLPKTRPDFVVFVPAVRGDLVSDTGQHRRPIHLVRGKFQRGADQPVWFDEPKLFFDHDGVSLGKPGTPGRLDLALYASSTVRDGVPVLWYPDRKFFLLGRVLPTE